MSWLGILLLVVGLYLAFKLAGALLKIVMLVLALAGAYWFIAPHMGWPTVSELVYVLGPDLDGHRIEDLADPALLTEAATDRLVDGVVDNMAERVALPAPEDVSAVEPSPEDLSPEDPSPEDPSPEPSPEDPASPAGD